MKDAVAKLESGRVENRSRDGQVRPRSWISSFRNIDDDKIEHEAFVTVWLSEFVFPDAWRSSISGNALPIAVRLARGEKIALAPAVLASLYTDLSTIHGFGGCESRKRIELKSLLKLVQVWVWERFNNIRPKEPREIRMGEARIARWNFRKKRCVKNDEKNDERLSFDGFEWRPYAKFLKNWSHPKFYVEEGKWMSVDDSLDDEFLSFARCLRASRLVGIGFVEDYYPNRVAMQFGFDQALPCLVTHLSNNITKMEAWDDYSKSLVGSKLYIPSRLATTYVTANYQDWWVKSVSEFLSNVRNTDDNDHGCGGSTSREETLRELCHMALVKRASEYSRNKKCKRAHEDDDNITIAEMLKSRKRTEEDASQPLGKRKRHEEYYNNDSGLCEKPTSEDETKTPQEMEPHIVAENIKTNEGEIGERARQRTLRMEKMSLKLEARVVEWGSVCKKLKHHLM